jgi:hypothetical protein
LLLLPAWARAQTSFVCPKAGTIVESRGGRKLVYAGTEPNDPVICKVTYPDGRHVRRLYGWYDPDNVAPGGDRSARLALQALFSDQKSEVTFHLITISVGQVSHTWRRLGRETIMLGEHPAEATIYQEDDFYVVLGKTPKGFGRSWKLWYDPSTGVIVKFKLISVSGPGHPPVREWTARSVATP